MSGMAALKMPPASQRRKSTVVRMIITPKMATEMLERNTINRVLTTPHVVRIAKQIVEGKWQYNGDTIKITIKGDILDGQHRLWAVIEANQSIDTLVVFDIEETAMTTVDTVRRPRSGADILTWAGATRYRSIGASALQWLLRWQGGELVNYRAPQNRVENSDIDTAYKNNPQIERAVERAAKLRGLANPAIMAFFYYILANRDEELAERMMATLEDPSAISVNDPFFRLRSYFTSDHHKAKDPLVTIAVAIKAANAAKANQKIQVLIWRNQGPRAEEFPKLKV